jgi:PAS domain-containing protein
MTSGKNNKFFRFRSSCEEGCRGFRDEAHNNRSSQGELDALRAALDNAGALIFSKDSHCRYTYANQRFCELVGASLEEVVGHTADEFFDADTATLLHEHDAEVLAPGRACSSGRPASSRRAARGIAT